MLHFPFMFAYRSTCKAIAGVVCCSPLLQLVAVDLLKTYIPINYYVFLQRILTTLHRSKLH